MTEPLISVVIPSYNYGRYLAQAIDSVLGQTYPYLEVIVVDDGSTDDSLSLLQSYREHIRWFQNQNGGVSAARNRGIRESRGELIAFLDADDAWFPEKLARQVELMKDPQVGMVYCGLQLIDAGGHPLGRRTMGLRGRVLKELALLRPPGLPASGSSPLVRRDCFERVGLFEVGLSTSADWDLWRRIACHYSIESICEPLVYYRLHSQAMHRNLATLERDMVLAFERMFADPAAAAVHHLRRQCYARLYLTLSGSYLHARRWGKCLDYAVRSLRVWPPAILYPCLLPVRRLQRWAQAAGEDDPSLA